MFYDPQLPQDPLHDGTYVIPLSSKKQLKTIKSIQVHLKCLKALCLKLLRDGHDWVGEAKVLNIYIFFTTTIACTPHSST